MNKTGFLKATFSLCLILAFMITSIPEAKAWKLFGKEEIDGLSFTSTNCDSGWGKQVTIKTYVFGIKTGERTENRCVESLQG